MFLIQREKGIENVAGVIGFPIGHSISPAMHNAAYKELKLPYKYYAFEMPPQELKKEIRKLRDAYILGFNVTVPHKEKIIPLLDEIDDLAKSIGAVNAVKNNNGKLTGYNTDAQGFIDSLKHDLGFNLKGKKAIIFGAGGAARAIGMSLAKYGAVSITITDIVIEKARELAQNIKKSFAVESNAYLPALFNLQKAIQESDIIINASPMGMHPAVNESPLEDGFDIPSGILVYDLVYNPPLTKLLRQALENGAKISNGLNMLVRQGALAFEIFTGKPAPFNVMKRAAEISLLM